MNIILIIVKARLKPDETLIKGILKIERKLFIKLLR